MFTGELGWIEILLVGLRVTFEIALFAGVAAGIIAVVLACGSISTIPAIGYAARSYVEVVRSVPIVVLLIFGYFGLGAFFGASISAYWVAVVVITVCQSSYLAEIYRGILVSVPSGQWNAARSIGLRRNVILRRVILPQAFRPAAPATINHFISTLKSTSLASFIAVPEATAQAGRIISRNFMTLEVYTVLAGLYVIIVVPLTLATLWLERKYLKVVR